MPAVVDDEGKEVPPKRRRQADHPATLAVHAAHDLWRQAALQKTILERVSKDNYFTGDGARRDKDGYFWIVGRIDDVLNVAGHRLGTSEIESALVSHPKVAEAAAVGRPDEIKGQGVVVFVTLKGGVKPTPSLKEELRDHVGKAHRRDRQARRSPFRRGAAENAQRKNHAPPAEGNRQRQNSHRRHDDPGRFQCSGKVRQRGRITARFRLIFREFYSSHRVPGADAESATAKDAHGSASTRSVFCKNPRSRSGGKAPAEAAKFPEVRNEIVALKKLEQEQKEVAVRIAKIEEALKQISRPAPGKFAGTNGRAGQA